MDPNQAQHIQAMIAGMFGIIVIIGLIFLAFMVFLFWRIFDKAGLAGPLALLIIIWPIGLIVDLCVLAFARWNVVPVPPYGAMPPAYPPQYPPQYPPAPPAPPTQLG